MFKSRILLEKGRIVFQASRIFGCPTMENPHHCSTSSADLANMPITNITTNINCPVNPLNSTCCASHVTTLREQGKPSFPLKRALIVSKLSRYEFERYRHPDLSEVELERVLRRRGSDYDMLLYHHQLHKECEDIVAAALRDAGAETRVVNRFDYTEANIEWADAIFPTGGDGTFLLAASRILNNAKPVVGFNSDPSRSEGYLCLPKYYSSNIKEAVDKIKNGDFKWLHRKRIRITLIGDRVFDPPIELHDQQLLHPEYRFFDCIQEQHNSALQTKDSAETPAKKRVLPVLALNEVFIGECLSARVSYYEMQVDGGERRKIKSSGMCVSTGTGSTSWTFSIDRLTHQSVEELVRIIADESGLGPEVLNDKNSALIDKITSRFNNTLVFKPDEKKMAYTIRDLICGGIWPSRNENVRPRGYAHRIEVKSRCFDAGLVVDGGISFSFNDGTSAILEIHDPDALLTISLLPT
ncbi:NAD kinase 2, mitochondrial isoform X1 [Hetaerina americana]|uniref:NAD kinase 2, mitochondrial isoform X1 n=2 Tax=Hetaerina americana TaxID=62018 RepID=UPI003A7F330D